MLEYVSCVPSMICLICMHMWQDSALLEWLQRDVNNSRGALTSKRVPLPSLRMLRERHAQKLHQAVTAQMQKGSKAGGTNTSADLQNFVSLLGELRHALRS